jgi:hypothetical protein
MVWVRERTIPTERPPLVGEMIANFCELRVPRGQRDGSLRPYSRFCRQQPLLFYLVAPQLYSRGSVDPVPDSLLFSGSAGNRTRASGSVTKNSDHWTAEAVAYNHTNTKFVIATELLLPRTTHFITDRQAKPTIRFLSSGTQRHVGEEWALFATWFQAGFLLRLFFALRMEPVCSYEIYVNFQQTTRHYIP